MRKNLQDFEVLDCIERNLLTTAINDFIEREIEDYETAKVLYHSLALFRDRFLDITSISPTCHDFLLAKGNFSGFKGSLKSTKEQVGLLLLPTTLFPDFKYVADADETDFPIRAILYSWSSINEHDRLLGQYDADNGHPNERDRYLFILPLFGNAISAVPNMYELTNCDDQFLTAYDDLEGRLWYGKIHDYVMAYIISKNQRHRLLMNSNIYPVGFNLIRIQEDLLAV